MAKPKKRKVAVILRNDSNINSVAYDKTILETTDTPQELQAHAHIHAVIADPYKGKLKVGDIIEEDEAEEVEEVEETESEEPKAEEKKEERKDDKKDSKKK